MEGGAGRASKRNEAVRLSRVSRSSCCCWKKDAPAEWTDPVAIGNRVKRGRQAEYVAAPVALVAQYYLVFVVTPVAELTVESEDVGGHA